MISELCIDVINGFEEMRSCLNTVTEHVCVLDKNLPAWFQAPTMLALDLKQGLRVQACALMNQLEYLDGQEPREILVGAGIIAASNETLDAITNLNIAKNKFKTAMLKLKAAKISTTHELLAQHFETNLQLRSETIGNKLTRMGLARVHLKQCYRKIPCFTERPKKIAWTWANTRSIKKVTVAEAFELLQKHHKDRGIEQQMLALQGLNTNEKLAIVQDLAPHLRANIVMPSINEDKRIMVKGPVPIFYLATDTAPLPELTPPGIKRGKDKNRVIRKDVKINPEPFLPAIRAHRYIVLETPEI